MNNLADIGTMFLGAGNPLTTLPTVGVLISSLVADAFVIAGVILIFIIIYSGIQMISASGDPQSFAKAQAMLTSGVTGFILVIAAWFIITILEITTGITIL